MTITEARKEILQDVVGYYNLDNRSVDENEDCVYNGPGGRKCAAARWMDNPELAVEGDGLYNSIREVAFNNALLNDTAKLAGDSFMCMIQSLHDYACNWTNKGLSEKGKLEVLTIRKEYIDEE